MRLWHAVGARPLRYLHVQSHTRLPCSSRLFGRLAANYFRHSPSLLDHDPLPSAAVFHPVEPLPDTSFSSDTPATHTPPASDNVDSPPSEEASAQPKEQISRTTARNRRARQNRREKKRRVAQSSEKEVEKETDQDVGKETDKDVEKEVESTSTAEHDISSEGGDKLDNVKMDLPKEEKSSAESGTSSASPQEEKKKKAKSKPPASPRSLPKRRERLKMKRGPSIRNVPTGSLVIRKISGNHDKRTDTLEDFPSRLLELDDKEVDKPSEMLPFMSLEGKAYSSGGSEGRSIMDAMLGKRPDPAPAPTTSAPGPSYKKPRHATTKDKPVKRDSLKPPLGGKISNIKASKLELTPLDIEQAPVPRLFHGLDRVLFNKGVYQLQDPHSMVYNFDPYIQKIMPVTEFDYNALKEYKTSSQDTTLSDIATEYGKKYVGSTSSMTGALGHFHYLLSNWRKLNLNMLSKEFPDQLDSFTELNRSPNAIFLRWKNGTYAIDADKQHDGANVLMLLGKSLEKLLTMPVPEFERYRRGNSDTITHEERNEPESYHYSTQGDFLMRSQLDAYDPRLPGTGMFDLKTRAVVSIRMQASDYEDMSGYEIHKHQGQFESFEREYYDMLRSTTLKYSLQARMGRMDGIFVAYHNVKRIFGFQYLSLNEMDRALHGQHDRCLGNQEFSLSVELLNKALDKATEKFPQQSIRFHFETRPAVRLPFMYIFAEPMAENEIDEIQDSQKGKVAEFERSVMGIESKSEETEIEESEKPVPDNAEGDAASESDVQEEQKAESATTLEAEPAQPDVQEAELGVSEAAEVTKVEGTASESPWVQDSSADSTFLSLLSESETGKMEKDLKPLLAMVLTVRSKVNGQLVDRPEDLKPEDKWNIEYTLDEVPSPSRAWSLYEATKARRQKSYDKVNGVTGIDNQNNDDGKRKNNDYYINLLKQYSQKGRKLRSEIDLAELGQEQVVLGEPHGKVRQGKQKKQEKQVDSSESVSIEGAQDYMSWLYGDKKA